MTKIFSAILLFVGLAASACDFSLNICSAAGISCPSFSNSITVNGTVYTAGDFGVISFNDFTLTHGDTQERVAVRNNFYGYNGISVADLLGDNKEFSLIVGSNVNWNDNGAIIGNIFAGNSASVTLPAGISGRATLGCTSSGCLNSYFDSIQNYWSQLSSTLSLQNANVDVTLSEGKVATLTCQGSANAYFVRLAPETFNAIVGYEVSGSCSGSASWVFNVIGSADVYFGGNPIQVSGSVIYNIAPAGKIVVGSSVNGNIIAPYSDLNMVRGTITGQIVAGNISNIIQVNAVVNCPSTPSGSSSSSSASSSTSSSSSVNTGSQPPASSSASASSSDSSASASTGSAGSDSTATTAFSSDAINQATGVIGSNNNENAGSLISYSILLVLATIALI